MERKVAVFGDSISKGIVYENEKLSKISEDAVTLIAEEYGYDIENYSKYGQSLKKLCEKEVFKSFVDKNECSGQIYAVICIGGNDANFNWKEVGENPRYNHHALTPVKEFEELLDKSVKILLEKCERVILTTIPPVDSKRYFENVICKMTDGEKVLEFFDGDVTNISRHQEAYNYAIIKCAIRNGCPIIDLRTGFLLDRTYLRNYCIDGVHPNGKGHRFMAEEVVRSLADQGLVLKKKL